MIREMEKELDLGLYVGVLNIVLRGFSPLSIVDPKP